MLYLRGEVERKMTYRTKNRFVRLAIQSFTIYELPETSVPPLINEEAVVIILDDVPTLWGSEFRSTFSTAYSVYLIIAHWEIR